MNYKKYSTKTETIKHIEYNRNGISGRPFYSIKFIYQDDNVYIKGTKFVLTGIISLNDINKKDAGSRFYVVSSDISKTWRGDNFGEKLIPKLKEFIKDKNFK